MGRRTTIHMRIRNNTRNYKVVRSMAGMWMMYAVLWILFLMGGERQTYNAVAAPSGRWATLTTVGVSVMHMTVNRYNKVICFDRTNFGPSRLPLPAGRCRRNPRDLALKVDCTAHSFEYDVASNKARPLSIFSDTWCSSGAWTSDGTLTHTGGFYDGANVVRTFAPCPDGKCDWVERGALLAAPRWYASNQILPDNRVIVVGGRAAFSYEFVPRGRTAGAVTLPFLQQTNTPGVENNLYPFVHLSSDGNLFIFANKKSILLDYKTNRVVKVFPDLPGGPRNYPSTGSSVMLPLTYVDGFKKVEILICGGSQDGAFTKGSATNPALQDCGRMVITDARPRWAKEMMPAPRVMGDMLILATGEILIINGAEQGTAGWGAARKAAQAPFLYSSWKPAGRRFQVLAASPIPRWYHSSAAMLHDGRVLVGGSNTNAGYVFRGAFPTELRLEAFSPYYLDRAYAPRRPAIAALSATTIRYGTKFTVRFTVPTAPAPTVYFTVYFPPFTTHSVSMSQRMLDLRGTYVKAGRNTYIATVTAPPSAIAAPSGYYMLRLTNNGAPSTAAWVRFV